MSRLFEAGKKWATQSLWFQLATTLIGVNVVDTFLLCSYHKVFNVSKSENDEGNKVSIQRFAGILASQLINYASKQALGSKAMFLPEDDPQQLELNVSVTVMDVSSPTISSYAVATFKSVIQSATDADGLLHYLVKYDVMQDPSGRKITTMRKCKLCFESGKWRDVGQYCASCGEGYSLCNK
jgi:hypothetical protein